MSPELTDVNLMIGHTLIMKILGEISSSRHISLCRISCLNFHGLLATREMPIILQETSKSYLPRLLWCLHVQLLHAPPNSIDGVATSLYFKGGIINENAKMHKIGWNLYWAWVCTIPPLFLNTYFWAHIILDSFRWLGLPLVRLKFVLGNF